MYLGKTQKDRLDEGLQHLIILDASELEYALNSIVLKYCEMAGGSPGGLKEHHVATALGALQMVGLEFYDKVVKQCHVHAARVFGNPYQEFIRKHNL
jgi:hypothetical protein